MRFMLRSVDALIDAVGGTAKAAEIGGVGPSAVSNWKSRGSIPSEKFMLFSAEMDRLGLRADPALFGFETAESRR